MLGKIAGGAFVVAATSKIGFDTAKKYEKRVKDLQALQSGLWLLKSEIDFSMTMLPIALKKCSTLLQKNIAELFCRMAVGIENGEGVYESCCEALVCTEIHILKNECEILKDFAKVLGSADADTENNNIEKTIERLKVCEQLAKNDCVKYSKICKTLGIASGIMLTVILI